MRPVVSQRPGVSPLFLQGQSILRSSSRVIPYGRASGVRPLFRPCLATALGSSESQPRPLSSATAHELPGGHASAVAEPRFWTVGVEGTWGSHPARAKVAVRARRSTVLDPGCRFDGPQIHRPNSLRREVSPFGIDKKKSKNTHTAGDHIMCFIHGARSFCDL